MWRATVIKVDSPGWVTVTIPSLFRDTPVGPVQCAVAAGVGERVIIYDLNPDTRARDWWVGGYESTLGKWGELAPHTHPLGQVDGLVPALAGKASTDAVAAKAEAPGAWSNLNLISEFSSYGAWNRVQHRFTAFGWQVRGLTRLAATTLAMDTVIATVPGLTLPGEVDVQVSTMGPGPGYAADHVQLAVRADGMLRTRQQWVSGVVYSFAHTIPL